VSDTLAQIEKKGLEAQQASEAVAKEEGDDDDDEIEELSDEDINAIAGISGAEESEEYDDGFGDDDDEEGEEWKKGGGHHFFEAVKVGMQAFDFLAPGRLQLQSPRQGNKCTSQERCAGPGCVVERVDGLLFAALLCEDAVARA
jgi:hypothetical protein